MRSGDDVLTKKISKTRGRKDSKTLNRHERKNFSLFSFLRHFEGFPRWEKSKRELIPKPSLEVPCPFLRLKEKGREMIKIYTVVVTTCPGVCFDRSR